MTVPRSRRTTTRRYVGPNMVVAAAGNVEHERVVELATRGLDGLRLRGAVPALGARRRPTPAPAVRFHAEADRAVPPVPRRRRASPRPTSAASPCACSTRPAAGPPPRACSRRCARSAGWPTRSTPTRASTSTRARWRSTSARGRTTCGEALEVIGGRAAPAAGRAGGRRGAAAGEGEREGPHGALDGVHARADEPARRSLLTGVPLLTLDEVLAAIDAVTAEDIAAARPRALQPGRCCRPRAWAATRRPSATRSTGQPALAGRWGVAAA